MSGILSRIEAELDAVDEKIGERMHILDLDNDGLVSRLNHHLHLLRLSPHELLGDLLLCDSIVLSCIQP